jgi:hypothetical protein
VDKTIEWIKKNCLLEGLWWLWKKNGTVK